MGFGRACGRGFLSWSRRVPLLTGAGKGRALIEPGLHLMDCMEGMRQFPDGFFDLAIVDPPYGDGNSKIGGGTVRGIVRPIQAWNRFGQRFDRYKYGTDSRSGQPSENTWGGTTCERTGGTWAAKYGKKIIAWDVAPGKDYFDELFRVSRDQIIWGGNYFDLPPTRCFLIWDKLQGENFSMAACEYAWTSFSTNAKMFKAVPMGTAAETRFHPTQKPVALYQWILSRYAKPGMKILDTHAGSASSLVACHLAGFDQAWGFEIDPVYFEKAKARLDKEKAQINIFELAEEQGRQMEFET